MAQFNNVEGWHARIKKNYLQAPPKHLCIDRVYPERGISNQGKIQSFRIGATSRQRRRRVKKEKRIQTLFDRFNAGNISLEEYLGAIKHQSRFNTSFMT